MAFRYDFIKDSSFSDLQVLFKKVFGKDVSIDYLKAKYDTSYTGHKHKATIAYDGTQPIAFYGVIPQIFKLNGREELVGHTCDSITVPEHQRKGLHVDLAQKCYDELVRCDFKFVYAFHSENTYHSTKKLGWKEQVRMAAIPIACNLLPIGQVADILGQSDFCSDRLRGQLKQFLIDNDSHLEVAKMKTDGRLYSAESNAYHSFTKNFWIEIEGCTFWLKTDRIVHVGYAQAPDEPSFNRAFQALKKACAKAGFNRILFQTHPLSGMHSMVKGIGNPIESWLVGYKTFDKVDLGKVLFEYADLDTF